MQLLAQAGALLALAALPTCSCSCLLKVGPQPLLQARLATSYLAAVPVRLAGSGLVPRGGLVPGSVRGVVPVRLAGSGLAPRGGLVPGSVRGAGSAVPVPPWLQRRCPSGLASSVCYGVSTSEPLSQSAQRISPSSCALWPASLTRLALCLVPAHCSLVSPTASSRF